MKTGRNEICHCGSGKKFKQCHQLRKNSQSTQLLYLAFISMAIVTTFFFGNEIFKPADTSSSLSPKPFSIENTQILKRPKGDAPLVKYGQLNMGIGIIKIMKTRIKGL